MITTTRLTILLGGWLYGLFLSRSSFLSGREKEKIRRALGPLSGSLGWAGIRF